MGPLAENAGSLARVRRGGVARKTRPVPLAQTLGRAVETLRAIHFDRALQVSVVCPEGLLVAGLPFLENVFFNILDCAVRHSSKEKPPVLRVGVVVDEELIRISFRDGERLEEELRLHLLQRPAQGTHSTGTDLGLTVVRETVVALGGTVTAGSAAGTELDAFEVVLSLPRV